MTTPRDIEDVKGLSADARRLFDWMTAAFTGDVNEALADAKKSGASISKWTRERLHKAHAELKDRGVLTADAPDLYPQGNGSSWLSSPQWEQVTSPKKRHHSTAKSPAQLNREIAATLVPHSAKGDRVLADLKTWGIDREQIAEVRAAFRAGDHHRAMAIARDLGWNRASKRGRTQR
jgi:hypothetical protein